MIPADQWAERRNLTLTRSERKREALIYILGRIGREPLPAEVWVFLAERLPNINSDGVGET